MSFEDAISATTITTAHDEKMTISLRSSKRQHIQENGGKENSAKKQGSTDNGTATDPSKFAISDINSISNTRTLRSHSRFAEKSPSPPQRANNN